jgi:hypothetical protein
MSEDRKMYMDPEDKHARLELWWDAAINKSKSDETGTIIHDKVLKILVRTPASPKQAFAAIVERYDLEGKMIDRREPHYTRYKAVIEQFKAGEQGQAAQGLPLTQWAMMDKATAKTFIAAGVHTREQLASLEGTQLQGIGMGAQTWKNKAIAHMEQENSGAEVSRLAGENEGLKKRLEQMEATLAQLAAAKPAKASKVERTAAE